MAILELLTKKNFVDHPPFYTVYDYWYNQVVDQLNEVQTAGYIPTTNRGDVPLVALPNQYYTFFDDFDRSIASAAVEACWTLVAVGTATALHIDGVGGILQLSGQATTDNSTELIYNQSESFRLVEGKELWYETRVRCPAADVTNLDLSIGLMVTEDISAVADNKPANGICFIKTDAGIGTIFLNSSDNNTDIVSAASMKTLVTNTWTRLGFHFDGGATGSGVITPYIDGVACATLNSITYATQAEMAPFFMVRNGDATTTQQLDIDYVHIVQER